MKKRFNPFTGTLDFTGSSALSEFNDKFKQFYASVSAFDKIVSVTYADQGTRSERIESATYSSATFPDADLVKTVYWLDVGTANQRIERIEYVAPILSPINLRKVYTYALSGVRFRNEGYLFEVF